MLARYRKLVAFDCDFATERGCLVGVDEAGRGALAGPVVAAAVVLPPDCGLIAVDDSKAVDEPAREALFVEIVRTAVAVGISFVQSPAIDRFNILNASLMAMARAIENLRVEAGIVLVDGRDRIESPARVISVVGGDHKSLSIAAASIVAKVSRDRAMRRLHRLYPEYNFLSNKGYGTKDHLHAIGRYGVTEVHRRSYRPNVVEKSPTLF